MNSKVVLVVIALLIIGFFSFTFQVDQRQTAIKLKFGKVDHANLEPGLHFKVPIMNTIEKYDLSLIHI